MDPDVRAQTERALSTIAETRGEDDWSWSAFGYQRFAKEEETGRLYVEHRPGPGAAPRARPVTITEAIALAHNFAHVSESGRVVPGGVSPRSRAEKKGVLP